MGLAGFQAHGVRSRLATSALLQHQCRELFEASGQTSLDASPSKVLELEHVEIPHCKTECISIIRTALPEKRFLPGKSNFQEDAFKRTEELLHEPTAHVRLPGRRVATRPFEISGHLGEQLEVGSSKSYTFRNKSHPRKRSLLFGIRTCCLIRDYDYDILPAKELQRSLGYRGRAASMILVGNGGLNSLATPV